jgi:Domain of unknown function (DUF6438)
MPSQPTDSRKFLDRILEPALAANLTFACVGAFLAHIANDEARINSLDDSLYVFLRAVFRIADLLHIPFSNPVTTAGVARNFDYSGKVSFAEEICIVILTFAFGALLFLFQRNLLRIFRSGDFLAWYAGVTALFAMPVLNLAVMIHDKGWYDPHEYPFTQPRRVHFIIAIFIGELIGVCILIVASRWRTLSLPLLSSLAALHCLSWMWAFWPKFSTYFGNPKSPSVLFFCFPVVIVVWIFILARHRTRDATETQPLRKPGMSLWLSAVAASCMLALLFLPNVFAALPTPQNPESQIIEISRGPCRGMCPVYTIRIHGNGLVVYSDWEQRGVKFPRMHTSPTDKITPAQLSLVMDIVRSAHLPRLDQRAFYWCFDSSSVSLAVITGQKTVRVISDGGCDGPESGVQAQFVSAAAAIEKVIGSEKWVCKDSYCDY